ncbi:MAG TPA: family 78 glycoside hydrolase catalytic domain [Acidimicrobiales bacterium]
MTTDQTDLVVAGLRTEYLESAVVGTATPRLSWVVAAAPAGWQHRATELRRLDAAGEIAEEATVDGDESVLVAWPFAPLVSREQGAVQVRVFGENGEPSGWTAPVPIEAGLLEPSDWLAAPVTADFPDEAPGRPIRFRRTFPVREGLAEARLYSSALGTYHAHCNGEPVGDELLAPGWTSYRHRIRYATHDLTDQLVPGPNALGLTVAEGWWRGRLGFMGGQRENYGDQIGPIAQLELVYEDGSTDTVVTDESWRAGLGPHLYASLYDGERYDARLEDPSWATAAFDDASWAPVMELEKVAGRLEAPVGPPVRRTEVLAPVTISRSPAGEVLVDFGQVIAGVTRIRVEGPAGTEVQLRHAEVLEHGELGTRPLRLAEATDVFILGGEGVETYEPAFTSHGFRYVEVSGWPGELRPADIEAVFCTSDLATTGTFDCSNDDLNTLHDNVRRSWRGNAVDLPTDCPQRDERLGWTGDAQVFAPTATFLTDCAGFFASWLQDLAAEQAEFGGVPVFVPAIPKLIPAGPGWVAGWSDAAVVVPWRLYERYGDLGVLERQYASMRATVDIVAEQLDDHGVANQGYQLGDWLDPSAPPDNPAGGRTDSFLVAQAYYCWCARLVADAADVLNRPEDAAHYREIGDRAATAFRREFATPSGRLASDSPTAFALALQFDLLADADQRERAGERLGQLVQADRHHIGTGFLGTPVVLDALVDAGHLDDAYLLLLQEECPSWLYQVRRGATTVWERWDSMLPDGTINPGEMTSFNHYAFGAVGDFLQRRVAGLAPGNPGGRHHHIEPRPGGGLTRAEATLETPYGHVAVAWHREGPQLHLEVDLPPKGTATVVLPDGATTELGAGHHELQGACRPASDDPGAAGPTPEELAMAQIDGDAS